MMIRKYCWLNDLFLTMIVLLLVPENNLPAAEVRTIAGNGQVQFSGDGEPALEAGVGGQCGLVIGPDGALYVCATENHALLRLDLKTQRISTVAGVGKKGYAGDGGPATAALCNEPYEVRFDTAGNIYFVEMRNHLVRKVDARSGIISTVAGTGLAGFSGDGGPATQATLNVPHSITLGPGHLFIADIGNHRVRVVDLKTGIIETLSGTGKPGKTPDGASLSGTPLNGPRALEIDGQSTLILALREGNAVYRIDLKKNILHHLAGTGKSGYAGDGGAALQAQLAGPKGVALGPNGDLYLADTESHTIRVIRKSTGIIETLVGDGKVGDGPDGDPLHCRLNRPHGVYVDSQGQVYIGDSSNNKVRVWKK